MTIARSSKNVNINTEKVLSPKDMSAINALLRKEQRVELIPTKTGVRVIHILSMGTVPNDTPAC